MNSFRRRWRKEGAAGNNNGGRGARAGRAALGAARPAVPAGSARVGSAQLSAGRAARGGGFVVVARRAQLAAPGGSGRSQPPALCGGAGPARFHFKRL